MEILKSEKKMRDRRNKKIDKKSFIFGFMVTLGSGCLGYYLIGSGGMLDILQVSASGALIGFPIGYLVGDSS